MRILKRSKVIEEVRQRRRRQALRFKFLSDDLRTEMDNFEMGMKLTQEGKIQDGVGVGKLTVSREGNEGQSFQ